MGSITSRIKLNELSILYQRFLAADEGLLLRLMQSFIAITIIMYLSPYLTLGSNNHWMIWDNLDSNYAAYKVLIDSGALFASNSTIIEQPLGGVPRSTMASEFDAFVWLYKLFGAEGAYVVNRILMTLVGFLGMYLLLRSHVLKGGSDEIVRLGMSLCFALLPFWPFGGLSVSGMPLALYAMLEIRNRNHSLPTWGIVLLYPFYSSLVLAGLFFLALVTAIWLFDALRRKTIWPLFSALVVISLCYLMTNYRLVTDFLIGTGFVSHRLEFVAPILSVQGAIENTKMLFFDGHAHAHSLHNRIIWPLIGVSVFVMLPRSIHDRHKLLFWLVMIALGVIALFYGFWRTSHILAILAPVKAILPIQYDRFYFLFPLLWILALSLVLSTLQRKSPYMRLLVLMVVLIQSHYAFSYRELYVNRNQPTAAQFFAPDQFAEIRDYIGLPMNEYRVASIGMHPSVSLYNGFYTIDGYMANYPLSYKHSFRKVIADELEKDASLKEYFDDWGSRVYLFNSQTKTRMLNRAGNRIKLQQLDYNWKEFHSLGGRYILSAVEIDVLLNSELNLEQKFMHASSAWDVYLYRVTPF